MQTSSYYGAYVTWLYGFPLDRPNSHVNFSTVYRDRTVAQLEKKKKKKPTILESMGKSRSSSWSKISGQKDGGQKVIK